MLRKNSHKIYNPRTMGLSMLLISVAKATNKKEKTEYHWMIDA